MMESKPGKVAYAFVLPAIVIILLLGAASIGDRIRLFGSAAFDLIIRILLVVWFCGLYVRLSRISTFSYFPNKEWMKDDVGPVEKYFYWGGCLFFGIGCGVLTFWVIHWFFPVFSSWAYVISAVNSLIIMIPLFTHYWVFKF